MTDILYVWKDGASSVGMSSEVQLPQFRVLGHRQRSTVVALSTGTTCFKAPTPASPPLSRVATRAGGHSSSPHLMGAVRSLTPLSLHTVGYTMRDIRYKWNEGPNSVGVSHEVSLPQFKVLGHRQRAMEISLTTGSHCIPVISVKFLMFSAKVIGESMNKTTYLLTHDVRRPRNSNQQGGTENLSC